jgi:signal transduction histidine kinase
MASSGRLLIVDDEELLRQMLGTMLVRLGYEVAMAESGREGLELCARLRPDLVLLDVRMPDLDGTEVCAALKADPELREIPVIFLSGLKEPEDIVRAIQAGAVDYITKPYRIEEVQARLQVHLDLRAQRRELERSRERLETSLVETHVLHDRLVEINERLARSESLKSHFLTHMRDEVHNPLSAILALADQIDRSGEAAERSSRVARTIPDEAFQLDFQLRNIFCAADLEAGELVPAHASVDIGALLREVVRSFAHRLERKSLSVRILAGGGGAPLRFPTDRTFLHAILSNLLANAIEFSPAGGTVVLEARREGDVLTLSVDDQGPGVPEADLGAIFERFRQMETGLTRSHPGQGLGLAVVKALVDLLDGEIHAENRPGGGFRLCFTLPWPLALDALAGPELDGNPFLPGEAGPQA